MTFWKRLSLRDRNQISGLQGPGVRAGDCPQKDKRKCVRVMEIFCIFIVVVITHSIMFPNSWN